MSDNDQATVDRLCLLTYTSDQEGEPHDCVEGADAARAILDAISKGEVPIPGMVTEAVWRAAEAEVERLRMESDPPVCRLQLPDGRVPGNAKEAAEAWHAAASAARNERDAEKARADKATAERDRLAGLLARLRHQVGKIMLPRTDCDCSDCLFMRSIDAALAEVGK